MSIVFKAPHQLFNPTLPNPFLHVPLAHHIPAAPGVYIVGVKILVSDIDGKNVEKFCPMIVGQAVDLNATILTRHRNPHYPPPFPVGPIAGMNKGEELFDFINNPINVVYQAIHWWNILHWNWVGTALNGLYDPYVLSAYPGMGQNMQKIVLYNHINRVGNAMIYFRCRSFFDFYLRLAPGTFPVVNNHAMSMAGLAALGGGLALALNAQIAAVKNDMYNRFYFSYALQNHWHFSYPGLTLNDAESITKTALEFKSIFTYARSQQNFHNNRLPPLGTMSKPNPAWDVDLSAIRNVLVNITGSTYDNPLIINV